MDGWFPLSLLSVVTDMRFARLQRTWSPTLHPFLMRKSPQAPDWSRRAALVSFRAHTDYCHKGASLPSTGKHGRESTKSMFCSLRDLLFVLKEKVALSLWKHDRCRTVTSLPPAVMAADISHSCGTDFTFSGPSVMKYLTFFSMKADYTSHIAGDGLWSRFSVCMKKRDY